MKRCIMIAAALLLSWPAGAYTESKILHAGGATFTLCNAYTGSSVCEFSAGVDYAANVPQYRTLSFYAVGSTGTFACQVYNGNRVVASGNTNDLSSVGSEVGPASLTQSLLQFTITNAAYYVIFVKCSTPGTVTITMQAGY